MKKRRPGPTSPDDDTRGMSILRDMNSCREILERLKLCEAEVREIHAHMYGGKCCLEAAERLAEMRKWLDRVFAKMTIGYIEQELDSRLIASTETSAHSAAIKIGMGKLLSRISE